MIGDAPTPVPDDDGDLGPWCPDCQRFGGNCICPPELEPFEDDDDYPDDDDTCYECQGRGRSVEGSTCDVCDGTGRIDL